jgi:uncharacterized RDD family membrane protein YckC
MAMAESCPKCGFEPVQEPRCPRCGVIVAQYLAYLESVGARSATAASREAATAPASTAPATIVAAAAPTSVPALRPAGFWIRALAAFIDYVFLGVLDSVLGIAARVLWGEGVYDSRVFRASLMAFQLVFWRMYTVVFHWLWGQTFGKMAVRVRVVTVAGDPLSLWKAILRELGYIVSLLTFGIGYLMAGIRPDKRALHDLIAGTRVEWTEKRVAG